MRIATSDTDQVQFKTITAADRARVSGAGLRAFQCISDKWRLTEKERIAALGDPTRSTYHLWMKKARFMTPVTLRLDTLLRISAVLGIEKSLSILFEDEAQALTWLRGSHRGTVFSGAAPVDFIVDGAQDGIMTVRRYLDGWRSGHVGIGAPEGSFIPVLESDIVFA